MPLGWYLAQGLYPLGPDSSDDDEGPCELPDGRVVCGPHGLVVCGKCCSDYSFMDEDVDEDKDEHEAHSPASLPLGGMRTQYPSTNRVLADRSPPPFSGTEKRRGTGRAFPTKFCPPSPTITPAELFAGRRAWMRATRYTHRNDPGMLLLLTDGACLNNGLANPKAGWAFVHHAGTGTDDPDGVAQGRLEAKGPFGDDAIQSSNRAELRAVIAALRFRHWVGENFHTVVIATDSEYVVEGSTVWAKNWVQNGWRTRARAPVKNSDLWEMLLGEVERWKEEGMDIQLWRIPREWNGVADAAAKKAAEGHDVDKWTEMIGMAV
ncbi:RNase H domain-containing protein [Apiospora phragmitis]|uniref:ribonuclease H n=1 Tax=Apiospora phragmitis TaxID=2905665 RepID=A0ABR1UM73_9PEZI